MCYERTDGSQDGQPENRNPQQIKREQRSGLRQLSAHVVGTDHCQHNQLNEKEVHFLMVGKSVQRVNEQTESDRIRDGTDIIEFTFRTLLLSWQVFDAEKQCSESQRHIDGKQPVPTGNGKNTARHRWSGGNRYGDYHCIDPHPPPDLALRIDVTQLCRIHTSDGGSAEPLKDTGNRQSPKRIGQGTDQ